MKNLDLQKNSEKEGKTKTIKKSKKRHIKHQKY